MTKPAVVIKTLEDSPFWLDQALVSAYLRTSYRINTPLLNWRVNALDSAATSWLQEQQARTFVFITAWNPYSKLLSDTENRRRNLLLKAELTSPSRLLLPALHVGDDAAAPTEAAFFVLDIALEKAVALGRQFEQNALVCWQAGGLPELWWLAY